MYSAFAAWGNLNSRQAASPLVRLMEEEERRDSPNHPQEVLLQIWDGSKPNRSVIFMVLKTTVNDRRTTSALPR
ncbi:hypothetical protein TNCV_4387091 [Trichonephila clavipes]|nr:hypothetical protein TNCV_4387091 [Trichonephila clavipes]